MAWMRFQPRLLLTEPTWCWVACDFLRTTHGSSCPPNKAPHWTQQTDKGIMAQRGNVSWQRPHTGKRWSWGLNPGFPPWGTSKEAGVPRVGIQGTATPSTLLLVFSVLLYVFLDAATTSILTSQGSQW